MIINKLNWLCDRISWNIRKYTINKINSRKLKNSDFSLLSIDCLGGVLLHDLGLKFNSPTVNLWFYPRDFIKFVNNLKYYLSQDMYFISEEGIDYPIGVLDDVKIYFTHYKNEEEAKLKFENRSQRINYEKLFVLMTDANGCDESIIEEFERIPYPHIMFTHKKYTNYKSTYYCKHDKDGVFHSWKYKCLPFRYCDSFNFAEWLNTGEISYENRDIDIS
ncbi:MAG: DUF1919 domain-containing protein [Eubacteriales bacterium]|nr:DUF1919 domain-containing protein [Eubacteriales bacterium]